MKRERWKHGEERKSRRKHEETQVRRLKGGVRPLGSRVYFFIFLIFRGIPVASAPPTLPLPSGRRFQPSACVRKNWTLDRCVGENRQHVSTVCSRKDRATGPLPLLVSPLTAQWPSTSSKRKQTGLWPRRRRRHPGRHAGNMSRRSPA